MTITTKRFMIDKLPDNRFMYTFMTSKEDENGELLFNPEFIHYDGWDGIVDFFNDLEKMDTESADYYYHGVEEEFEYWVCRYYHKDES